LCRQLRDQDAKSCFGFVATCHQAKQEAEEEGVHHLWQYVQDLKTSARGNRYELGLPHTITTASDFIELKELTVTTDASLKAGFFGNHLHGLVNIAVDNLRIHFTSSEVAIHPNELVRDSLKALEELVELSYHAPNTHFVATNVTISWDYRHCTLEDHYEAKKNNELRMELRSRGVKRKNVPKRKYLMVDALLLHDRNNNATPPSETQQRPLAHTLYGQRFHLDQSDKTMALISATNRRDSVGIVYLERAVECTELSGYITRMLKFVRSNALWRATPFKIQYVVKDDRYSLRNKDVSC
jgi:hypothetical protein